MLAPRLLTASLLLCGIGTRTIAPMREAIRLELPRGFQPTAVAAADANGDDIDDIAVAGESQQLIMFLNDGQNHFSAVSPAGCGVHPLSLAVSDLNRDGHVDLVVANHEADYVTLMLGDGAGRFASRQVRVHSKPHPHAVAISDFDEDGRPDIVVDSWLENRLMVLLGRDDWRSPGTVVDVGRKPYSTVSVADVDGDGHQDLVAPNEGRGSVSLLLGDGRGHFSHAAQSPLAAGPVPFAAAIADVTGDGRLDVVVANYSGHADRTERDGLTWIRNDGERRFTAMPERVAAGRYVARVVTGDVNGDGVADAAFSNSAGAAVTIVYGSPSGLRGADTVTTMASPHALALGNLNRDARADLVVTSEAVDEVYVFLTK
jgi:FG-GAP-like repeat